MSAMNDEKPKVEDYDPEWVEESEDDGTTRADGLDKDDEA